MADEAPQDGSRPRRRRRRLGCWTVLAAGFLLLAALLAAWLMRSDIAGDILADELDKRGIEATYKIERIGARRQVLSDVVIGDPRRPDLTIERLEIRIRHRFGFPVISRVTALRPRLFGTYRGGELSFGSLDPLLFTGEEGPFEFPDLNVTILDGRGLMETDFGRVGLKLAGRGQLRGGFAGEMAAIAPELDVAGCRAERATLYGRVAIRSQRPEFAGPVRVGELTCSEGKLALGRSAIALRLRADRELAGLEGSGKLSASALAAGPARLGRLTGTTEFTWRGDGLTARYDLAGSNASSEQVRAARLAFAGALRARESFKRVELQGELEGGGIVPGAGLDRMLAGAVQSADGTLLEPILERIRRQLQREGQGSDLRAELTFRRNDGRNSVVVPQALLRGSSGVALLSLSRFQFASGPGQGARFSGNFVSGGEGLPRVAGRMEQRAGGGMILRATMARYAAADSSLQIPQLLLVQRSDGALGFTGLALADGPLPGGFARGSRLPLAGNVSPGGEVSLWRACTEVRFDALRYANLSFGRQRLTLCPPPGTAIVRLGSGGLRVAAGAPSLALSGMLGGTPIALRSGPVGLAYPGALSARRVNVALGPAATATTFAINDLTAIIGKDVAGRFAGTDVRLFNVPLDVMGASGAWRYAGGRLVLSNGSFRLIDRQQPHRFEPMFAEGATLQLYNNLITADAVLREPVSGRTVVNVDLAHNLATAGGHADLAVPGILFDRQLQPTQLTPLALGIVANVRGLVTGTGRIDWNAAGVTSTGRFSSDSLDFAAAFGPVKGASGTVVFSDLLGLTTAPRQTLRVASINPGIEVLDGTVSFGLVNGQMLQVNGGTWPFLGGTLTLRPVTLNLGTREVRRYVFEVVGLDAALFVPRMELNNLSATGIFDGTIPIVFDEDGNGRLEGGMLLSRPPGGNVSYVGELTYKDLTPIANFAFDALRSLDYRQMQIQMDGSLTGEIVTRIRFEGVSQGAGAKTNFITRRLANLPLRFMVNIRAPFYSLITSLRAMYDPSAIRDPRELGLLDREGNVIRREVEAPPPAPGGLPVPSPIQANESESVR